MGTRKKSPSPRRLSRKGIALLITMIVVMLYAILSHHYIYIATSYSRIVANQRDEKVAYWVAKGGLYRARALLKLDSELQFDSLNEDWTRPISGAETKGFEYVDGTEVERQAIPDGMEAEVTITDEEGKFNILLLQHTAVDEQTRRRIRESFARLIEILRRNDKRLSAIRDYDPDWEPPRSKTDSSPNQIIDGIERYLKQRETDEGTDAGFSAERGRGASMKKQSPYTLLTIKELLLAERMTPSVLLGYDPALVSPGNPTGKPDEDLQAEREEREAREFDPLTGQPLSGRDLDKWGADSSRVAAADDRSYSRRPLPLVDYITNFGDGRINVNTASREVLLALSEHLTWQMVEDILVARDAAKARETAVEQGREADPVDPNAAPPVGETGNPATGEEPDNRSFRAADIASATAFYNRIVQNIVDDRGNTPEPAAGEEGVPEAWKLAFEDLRPFLTVRSRHFRVRSSAKVDKIRRTLEAVFRRDQGGATPAPAANPAPTPNQPGTNPTPTPTPTPSTPNDTTGTGRAGDPIIPNEPNVRLSLVYLNDVD